MVSFRQDLPASELISNLRASLLPGNVIVGAPPGAGKSTVLPLALLDTVPDRIIMLQPRRVVVRNLASYLASQLGEEVGQSVGYRIRGENKTSRATRLEIVTEGVLARLIQHDPELNGISLIIFDEFHERSIHSDFGLALALEVQEGLREDLSLLVMSATLDVEELTSLMPTARVLKSSGRQFDVEEVYVGQVAAHKLHEQVSRIAYQSFQQDEGDILVFLPGVGAINRVAAILNDRISSSECFVHTLYGSLSKNKQLAAIQPDANGRRKIILATNVAETSLTIEGIKVVVDSGLENVATFHQSSGFNQLNTQMISQASATQRKGRAGRLGPGKVYRLWPQEQQSRLAQFPLPQILREDIASLQLEALAWGTPLTNMAMLTKPTHAQISGAKRRLNHINAIDEDGAITPFGRQISRLPVSPALAAMLLQVKNNSNIANHDTYLQTACWVAALAEENAISSHGIHLSSWLPTADSSVLNRLQRQAERLASYLGTRITTNGKQLASHDIASCLALAFPERVAKRKQGNEFKLASGRGALLPEGVVEKSDWLVVLHGQVSGSDVMIRMAEPITELQLRQLYPEAFSQQDTVSFNPQKKQMEARKTEGFYSITLKSEPVSKVPAAVWQHAWLALLENLPLQQWPLSDNDKQWWRRYQMACEYSLSQPQAFDSPPLWEKAESPLSLLDRAQTGKRLANLRQWEQLANLPWASLCHQALPWSQQHALDTFLPVSLTVPSGEKRKLHYRSDGEVILSVKLQEMFGCADKFIIAEGKKVVTLELLSPAGRPIQTTSDLGSFWQGSYFAVQKDMKGRYPKHRWPDNPMEAEAGRSIKPKKPG